MEGIDFAWGRPGTAAIKKAGKEFVVRYLSHDDTGKTFSLTEAAELTNAGIWCVYVFEDAAGRALKGKQAGIDDATFAARQAKAFGAPADRPIYFASDTEVTTAAQMTAVMSYLDGVASVIGLTRTGVYGQFSVIKQAFDLKKIAFGWQTYAWSGGRWDTRAQLQQYRNEVLLNGVDVDLCRSTTDDFGQWMIGKVPGMTLSEAEMDKIAARVVTAMSPMITGVRTGLAAEIVSGVLNSTTAVRDDLIEDVATATAAKIPTVDTAPIVQGVLDGLAHRMEN